MDGWNFAQVLYIANAECKQKLKIISPKIIFPLERRWSRRGQRGTTARYTRTQSRRIWSGLLNLPHL